MCAPQFAEMFVSSFVIIVDKRKSNLKSLCEELTQPGLKKWEESKRQTLQRVICCDKCGSVCIRVGWQGWMTAVWASLGLHAYTSSLKLLFRVYLFFSFPVCQLSFRPWDFNLLKLNCFCYCAFKTEINKWPIFRLPHYLYLKTSAWVGAKLLHKQPKRQI